jgi:anti-sigma-K factor RskA
MSELDYTEALAAEYVLGTLDFEERTRARALLDADEAFAAKVELWERRFGELHHMVEPVEPEAAIWARIKAKMPDARQKMQPPAPEVPPPEFAPTASEPPSLDAIQAAISQAATTLTSEANSARATEPAPAPMSEGMQMPASEATPAPASEATLAPASEAPPAPASEATPAPTSEPAPLSDVAPALTPAQMAAVEPVSPAPVVPPAAAALEAPSEARTSAVERATVAVHRRMRRWRAFAILMMLVVAAVVALLAAWTFAPDRVPPMLQPVELLRQIGVSLPSGPAPRRPAPPGSQFDE